MLILGHELIASEPFYRVASIEAIAKTPSQAIVLLNLNLPWRRIVLKRRSFLLYM